MAIPRIGEGVLIRRFVTQEDFNKVADITGDYNPIHVDPEFAAKTRFKKTVAHGVFLYGLIKDAIWKLLGNDIEIVEQELMFTNPTYADEEITVWVTVSGVQREQQLVNLDTFIIKSSGHAGCRGSCVVRLLERTAGPQEKKRPDIKGHALDLGMKALMKRLFTAEDVKRRMELVGDKNPIYVNEEYASKKKFEKPIVPEDMLMGMISTLLGTRLPGLGTMWMKQKLRFLKPAYLAEEITATVEITQMRPEKDLINLKTYCTNQAGEIVCEGEALVLFEPIEEKS